MKGNDFQCYVNTSKYKGIGFSATTEQALKYNVRLYTTTRHNLQLMEMHCSELQTQHMHTQVYVYLLLKSIKMHRASCTNIPTRGTEYTYIHIT